MWSAELVVVGLASVVTVVRVLVTETGWPDEGAMHQWITRQPLQRLLGLAGLFHFGWFLMLLGAALP